MYERVQPVDTSHQHVLLHEKLLYWYLPEYVPTPFNVDHLKSVPAGDMNSVLLKCDSCESTAELVDLERLSMPKCWTEGLAHPVY